MQPLALDEAVRSGMADAHTLAVAHGTDVSLDAPHRVMVHGDADALRVLVRNLLDNAIRYAPANGSVRARVFADAAGAATLEVDDSGPGIRSAERERVFDRFYRGDGSPEGGSGLGVTAPR
jgi:signal transduction histidine kinase